MKGRGIASAFVLVVLAAPILSGCGGAKETAAPEPAAPEAASPPPAPAEAGPTGNAVVSGTIHYQGKVPKLSPIQMAADPTCAAKHKEPQLPEILVLGPGNALANVLVRIKGGLLSKTWPAPSSPAVFDQNGCTYKPHVLALMTGQTLKVLNSDGLLHNVHALPKVNKEFNLAMPANLKEKEHVFDKPEDPFRIKCDVHPWMGAFICVMPHPFFSVSGKDGAFSISGLPAGTYEVEAWHEKLPAQTQSVTVKDGETKTLEFTFSSPGA
jgi:plastocyanin